MRPLMSCASDIALGLKHPSAFDHPVSNIEIVETHISWIVLTGSYAYKIKKPVNLGFLDFSTLDRRRFYCIEEVRLNRRLAPELYIGVVPITGTISRPTIGGTGPVIDYAVKMKQFNREDELGPLIAKGEIDTQAIANLARDLSEFHRLAPCASKDSPFGNPDTLLKTARENVREIRALMENKIGLRGLEGLEKWTESDHLRHFDDLAERHRRGSIRECHGDLHTGNLVLIKGRIVPFDCIEFNESFRWIDVMNDIAFLAMDLDHCGNEGLRRVFLNAYLEASGDYQGLRVFRTYQVYRSLVRAKVAAIRLSQLMQSNSPAHSQYKEFRQYINLARRYLLPRRRFLAITHGLSGSGKTSLCRSIIETTECIMIRSDIERKRLYGLSPMSRSSAGIGTGIYSSGAGDRTYRKLADLAEMILDAGYPVVVDATFLKHSQRKAFRQMAERMHVPFIILDLGEHDHVLRERIMQRSRDRKDASEAGLAVLDYQIKGREPLMNDEILHRIGVESENDFDVEQIVSILNRVARKRRPYALASPDLHPP